MLVPLTIGFAGFIILVVLFALYREYAFRTMEGFQSDAMGAKTVPGPFEGVSDLQPAVAMHPHSETLLSSVLPSDPKPNLGTLTSEQCFRADIGESLKLTRNFLQRTNNYRHAYPDSCSAPNHELIGTFYTPINGIGNFPPAGTNYPPSTQTDQVYAI